jgi:hypothetical protein
MARKDGIRTRQTLNAMLLSIALVSWRRSKCRVDAFHSTARHTGCRSLRGHAGCRPSSLTPSSYVPAAIPSRSKRDDTYVSHCKPWCAGSGGRKGKQSAALTALSMNNNEQSEQNNGFLRRVTSNPTKTLAFTALITLCGAALGPSLDSYHSAFGVLHYDSEITFALPFLGGTPDKPALTTAWWVPELFGLAGIIIGWLYILLDDALLVRAAEDNKADGREPNIAGDDDNNKLMRTKPSPPLILLGISAFTFQYYLSGVLVQMGVDRTTILNTMSILAAAGFLVFDNTLSGLFVSAATAIGGPLVEVGLISILAQTGYGYHYTDSGETGFFPLWILPGENQHESID